MSFGILLGFSTFWSLSGVLIFLIVCLFRVNFSVFFLSLGVFSLLSFALDPLFDWFGYVLLVDLSALRSVWIYATTGPIFPFFHFNNTIVIGSLVAGLLLWLPVFLSTRLFVIVYRRKWKDKVVDSPLMKVLKAAPLYGWYTKYENLKAKFSIT